MDFSDDSEIYDEEVNEIRPYMYEPRAVSQGSEKNSPYHVPRVKYSQRRHTKP